MAEALARLKAHAEAGACCAPWNAGCTAGRSSAAEINALLEPYRQQCPRPGCRGTGKEDAHEFSPPAMALAAGPAGSLGVLAMGPPRPSGGAALRLRPQREGRRLRVLVNLAQTLPALLLASRCSSSPARAGPRRRKTSAS